ncbi:zinc finger CCCH domain-containing protein 48-like isoform X1 [Coffea eugenioides]|uniref:zinc finger CCCH domain-containing protein 48-like isoform X1 n=1 Tax=Coffea eugenioides TaxID=49369 RepID=UPI000F60BB08|nr:zinc finger CCCH domain-containing protein 48-like isoform X1 [Coffea eugenioides]
MEIKTESRPIEKPRKLVFNRSGSLHYGNNQVCGFWLAGKCNRNPCRFRHVDSLEPRQDQPPQRQPQPKRPPRTSSNGQRSNKFRSTWRNPDLSNPKILAGSSTEGVGAEGKMVHVTNNNVLTSRRAFSVGGSCQKSQKKLCPYWVSGNCVHGEKCKDLHSLFSGSGFSLLTKLQKHSKAVTGIALPSGSDKLFSGSKDNSVCVWDCHTGQCVVTAELGGEIGCLISEGLWVFAGLQNAVKAWNIESRTELVLSGPNGLVHAMDVGEDMLFGGVQDGSILVWKSTSESCSPEPVAFLMGHRLAVLSLVVGANCLYSGSKDESIRVWDLKTLQCLQILNGHKNFVTSVLCWDKFLLSGSLDNRLKVWAATEFGDLEVVNEVEEDNGILALCGIHDAENKPILLCSCKDNSVCLYDLPSFAERGRIYAQEEVQTIAVGCGPLFFTGGAAGELSVWKLHGDASGSVGCS